MTPEQLRRLIDTMSSTPSMLNEQSRLLFMQMAGLEKFIPRIPISGDARIFSFQLVNATDKYGIMDDGEHAMLKLLRAVREEVKGQPALAKTVDELLPLYGGNAGAAPMTTNTPAASTDAVKILFVAANPFGTSRLRLDKEQNTIDEQLRKAALRDKFELKTHLAARWRDLMEYLLRHQPHIVHFSGHGTDANEITLEDDSGKPIQVSAELLSMLFGTLRDNICCVVLNACWTEKQAIAIAQHIDCVVGMANPMNDGAAVQFASGFYMGLGYGRNVQTAFDLGKMQLALQYTDFANTPQIKTRVGADANRPLCKTSR